MIAFAIFYVVIAAIALGVHPFRGQTVTPFDLLVSQQGWHEIAPNARVRDQERSDVLDALLPGWIEARQQIRSWHLPYWNPDVAGGAVALPNLVTGLLTPDFVIFAATPNPALGFYLAMLFNLAVAGLGMHLFLRRKLGLAAAVAGGVSFALCGFIAAWLYWPHVRTVMWLPWLLLAVDSCVRRPCMRTSVAVALATAMVVLGGFPFVGMLALEVAGLYLLASAVFAWRKNAAPPWRLLGWYAVGSMLGFVLCALPLLTFVGWLSHFNIDYRPDGSFLGLHELRLLLAPWAYAQRSIEATMYTGSSFAVLAGISLIGVVALWRRNTVYSVFAAIVLVASAGLVFSVWPVWLVEKLPGMAHNQWSRAISILDVGVVLMGALAVDFLWRVARSWRWRWRWAMQVLVIALVVGQIVDVGTFFRSFNGPVPKRFYYPRTPAINYMASHVGPFDYVIADRSYLVSGSLGAYGMREWFAHAFRKPALHDALLTMADHPFSTATASRLDASQIRFSSPAMATYNVRFVAIDANESRYAIQLPQPNTPAFAMPPLPANRWIQRFDIAKPIKLTGIALQLATYLQVGLHGELQLRVISATGTAVATVKLDARNVVDNQWTTFHFAAPISFAPGAYEFSVSYTPADGDTRFITAWAIKNPHAPQAVLGDGSGAGGTLEYQLLYPAAPDADFKRVFSDGSVVVYANRNSPNGPYFVPNLSTVPNASSARDVRIDRYRPSRFALRYTGRQAGYIVVPMTMARGWGVDVDGKTQLHVALKNGVMPAVAVDGPTSISFRYRPPVLRWLYPWLAVLTVWLIAMFTADKWLRRLP